MWSRWSELSWRFWRENRVQALLRHRGVLSMQAYKTATLVFVVSMGLSQNRGLLDLSDLYGCNMFLHLLHVFLLVFVGFINIDFIVIILTRAHCNNFVCIFLYLQRASLVGFLLPGTFLFLLFCSFLFLFLYFLLLLLSLPLPPFLSLLFSFFPCFLLFLFKLQIRFLSSSHNYIGVLSVYICFFTV